MATIHDDRLLDRLRKLVALAEDGASEAESLRAGEQVHRLLAAHNLTLADLEPNFADPPERRSVDSSQSDPLVDGWTIRIWHATAELFFCRYFYREEGDRDRAGRWRARHYRHCLVGTPANQITAKVMADHFCRTVRRLARARLSPGRSRIVERRSFESGCAARLSDRIRAKARQTRSVAPAGGTLPALLDLYEREAQANDRSLKSLGIALSSGGKRPRRGSRDVLADHLGREAAEQISLALQIGSGDVSVRASAPPPPQPGQMLFNF